jgi:hypothetical protein
MAIDGGGGRMGAMSTYRTLIVAAMALALSGCAHLPAPDPVGPSPTATLPAGDSAPHNAENNGWKQRSELSAADRRLGEEAAARIRPALEGQRAKGDFTPEGTRATLVGLGYPAERVQVATMHDPTITGAVFAVRVGERGCVIGDVQPLRMQVEVQGSAAEFGCLEPFSH